MIGGGSGGLACAKEATKFGKKVALLDYGEALGKRRRQASVVLNVVDLRLSKRLARAWEAKIMA